MSSPLFPLREDPGALRLVAKAGAGLQQAAAGDQPQSAGAWNREMERAQLDTWFKPRQAAPRSDGRPEGTTSQATLNSGAQRPASSNNAVKADGRRVTPPLMGAGPVPNRGPGIQAAALMVVQAPKPEASRMLVTDIRAASLALALAGVSRLKVVGLAPPTDPGDMADALNVPAGLGSPSEEADLDSQAIRLHAEWHGHDVAVWLGVDARADSGEEQLAQLLPHIRACLQGQRSRLVKLVCNGKTVFEVSSSFIPEFPYFTQSKEFP